MSEGIKPIETVYGGYRFRSRLEARWAVFLEHLGLKFDYEPEGFELPGGVRYLPDFWVHPQVDANNPRLPLIPGFWLEVKGEGEGSPSWPDTFSKASALAECSRSPVALFAGQIEVGQRGYLFDHRQDRHSWSGKLLAIPAYWTWCPWCQCVQPVTRLTDMECMCWRIRQFSGRPESAALAAIQARFEHGERGR